MIGRVFMHSNIAIYSLDPASKKGQTAIALLRARPIISTQVVMETVNVLIRKLQFDRSDAIEFGKFLMHNSKIATITKTTLDLAFSIAVKHDIGHWDSLIIAAAVESECTTIFSEDLSNGQRIMGVTIRNPF